MKQPTIKIGYLPDTDNLDADEVLDDAFAFALDEAYEDGLVDRPFEVVVRRPEGLPRGSAHDVLTGWKELEAEGVLAIWGPLISDNLLAIRTYVEDEGHVPCIGWGGTDDWYGEWCFGANNGSLSEEPYLIANFLAHEGTGSVAVVVDNSAIGEQYLAAFVAATAREGIQIVRTEYIGQLQTELDGVVGRAREAEPDALVYLGWGFPAVHFNPALERIGWDPLRAMNGAFMSAPILPEGLDAIRGWVGVDQYDEGNPITAAFLDRFEARKRYRPANFLACLAYDTGKMIAEACRNARPLSREGVKRGLEQITLLPAATGAAGTMLSFGPYRRRCWVGADYIVMRESLGGDSNVRGVPPTVLRHKLSPIAPGARRTAHEAR